jgi:glycosyltransferase involved in cell wall biosynthesis
VHILFLTDNFPPEVNAPASRTYEHCVQWVKQGASVTVITCNPNFPQGKVYDGYKNKLYHRESMDGVTVIRVWSFITANQGFVKRTLDYLSFAILASFAGLFHKTDVIVATSPQFFTTWAGCFLGFVKRKPWIFELRDLWPESIATVGAMKKGRLFRYLESVEMLLYKNARLIVPNTDALKINLVKRGIDHTKIHVISNGVNMDFFKVLPKDEILLDELNLSGKFVYGYIGTHGMAHSLDFVIETIAKIKNPKIHFLFVGDGAMKQSIVKRAAELKLTNVTFLDSVSKNLIGRYISVTDAALVHLKDSDTFKTVIPSKIFESCAMQKPILLGVDGQAREIVEKYDVGLFFKPENSDDFMLKAQEMYAQSGRYTEYKQNCLKLARAYDRIRLADEMLEVLNMVARNYRS